MPALYVLRFTIAYKAPQSNLVFSLMNLLEISPVWYGLINASNVIFILLSTNKENNLYVRFRIVNGLQSLKSFLSFALHGCKCPLKQYVGMP